MKTETNTLFIWMLTAYLAILSPGMQGPKLFEKHLPVGKVVFYKTASTSTYITPRKDGEFYILGGEKITQDYTLFLKKKSATKIVVWKKTMRFLSEYRFPSAGKLEVWDVTMERDKGYILYLDENKVKIDNIHFTAQHEWRVVGTYEIRRNGQPDIVLSGKFQNNNGLTAELQIIIDGKKHKEVWILQNGAWVKEKHSVPIEQH